MSTIDSQEEGESFRWRVRLSDNAPEKRVVVFAAAVLAFGFGWFGFKSPPLGIIGFAIILASTAEYWLGTSFAVDEKGASARTGLSLVAIDWADVKRLIWDEKGVRLSPLAAAGTMDAFRGVYLRYGWDNREAIERVIISIGRIRGIVDGGADAGAGDLADRKDRDGSLPPETADAGGHDA